MNFAIVTAADGAGWEAALVGALAGVDIGLRVTRRCVDVVELAAVAASGQGSAALVDAQLRRLDADIVERLTSAGIAVIGVITSAAADADIDRLRAVGIPFAVPGDAAVEVFLDVIQTAMATLKGEELPSASRAFGDPASSTGPLPNTWPQPPGDLALADGSAAQSSMVIAVWGPTGAPGRTTVATNLAEEISRLGVSCMLIDADVYGGVVANVLGLIDESPGLVAACRQAQSGRLDPAALSALCWQLNPHLRVLTGAVRADRWPELRPSALDTVLAMARTFAECVVIDVGFALETDEELSFDTAAPRRNGATLSVLDAANLILAIGAADPVGMQRLIRGLDDLRSAEVDAPVWVVMNKVRTATVPGKPEIELDNALKRFAGRASSAFLPFDQEALDRALVGGKLLAESAPGSPLRIALTELAHAVTGRPAPARGRRRR